MKALAVLTTFSDVETARSVAQRLVAEELAACVNILPGIESCYRWQGKVETSREVLCLCKTTAPAWPDLCRRLKELHPYEAPEIICLNIEDGWEPYLEWMRQSVRRPLP